MQTILFLTLLENYLYGIYHIFSQITLFPKKLTLFSTSLYSSMSDESKYYQEILLVYLIHNSFSFSSILLTKLLITSG